MYLPLNALLFTLVVSITIKRISDLKIFEFHFSQIENYLKFCFVFYNLSNHSNSLNLVGEMPRNQHGILAFML